MAIQQCIIECVRCKSAFNRINPRLKLCNKCRKIIQKPYPRTFYVNKKIVLERDGRRCQCCGTHEKLITHHIDVNRHNNSLSNLITLCNQCHISLHSRYNKLQLRHSNIYNLFPDRFRWGKFGKRAILDNETPVSKKIIKIAKFHKHKPILA